MHVTRSSTSGSSVSAVLDDLEAVAVELRLMQPIVTARNGLGGGGDARTDELRWHAQDAEEASTLGSSHIAVCAH